MKALMLHSENSGVGKYRIWTPAKYLAKTGWDVARIPDEPIRIPNDRGYDGDDPVLLEAKEKYGSWEELAEGSDIIVMQRPDQPESIALGMALREMCNAPLVFEVDDNIYDVAENSTAYKYWYPGSPLFEVAELLMRNADAITVSTNELVDVYKHLNSNIYVLQNCQDPTDWKNIVRPKPEDKIVIGWAGSATHYDDIYLVRRAIKRILRNNPNVVFRMLGFKPDFFEKNPQIEIETNFSLVQNWTPRLAKLRFDIGIAPVVDRPFNRGKSNIKWQEYAMLEIPTVASKVGPYRSIRHGEDGYLATTEDEWVFYLEKLIKDAKLRRTIGKAAKQTVLNEYNIEKNISQWDVAYREIIKNFTPGDYLTTV